MQDRLQVEHLTVNYRTPARIMDRALAMARAHRLPVTEVSSVREGERDPEVLAAEPSGVAATAAGAAARLLEDRVGRIAVIAAPERITPLAAAMRELPALTDQARIGLGSAGVDDEVAVMTAQDAKGLEFDAVVVVEPAELIEQHGAGDLYVALTRPTTRLSIVHARPLPEGLGD